MISSLACPRCKSELTQKLAVIIAIGAPAGADRKTRLSTSAGVIPASSIAFPALCQCDIAKRFARDLSPRPPALETTVSVVILALSIFVGLESSIFFSSTACGWVAGVSFAAILAGSWQDMKGRNKPEARALDLKKQRWRESGCHCIRCGHTFIPGQDEIYDFS